MGQPQSNQWAKTAQRRPLLRNRRNVLLAVAALMAIAAIAGLHSTGSSGSAARSLLCKYGSSSTADAVADIDDSIVFGVFGHRARIRQVQAGRGWRKGHRTVVAADMEEIPEWLAEDAAQHRETWTFYPEFIPAWHRGDRRGAMLPLLVFRELGDTFKWLFYGDDDTMWLRPNPDLLVQDYNPDGAHVLTDNWWPDNDKIMRYTHYGPRCMPCHLKPEGSNGTTRTAQGFTAVFACEDACTPQLLCDHLLGYGEYWHNWFNASKPLNCSDPNASGANWDMPHGYSMHGGGGAIFSTGALRSINASGEAYEACTGGEPYRWNTGSDAILTRCLWTVGLAFTDPGFASLPPGVDPATFPDSPLHIDDPYIMFHVERKRLFGGYGYSNWKDIRAMLAGLPPKTGGEANITACPPNASLCDRDSQADYLRRAVTTHVAARDIPDPEAHIPFMEEIWRRFSAWRNSPEDTRPVQKAAEIMAVPWR